MSAPYGATILEHARRPRNVGTLEGAEISREGVNPLCGDRVRIEAAVRDDAVADARFKADACAITTAAASLLTEMARGRALAELESLSDDAMLRALAADIRPGRVACALLPLNVLREGIRAFRAGG